MVFKMVRVLRRSRNVHVVIVEFVSALHDFEMTA